MHLFTRTLYRAWSPRAAGIAAAAVTVLIWSAFILLARAAADPSRGGTLSAFDISFCRIVGAGLILLPWGRFLVWQDRRAQTGQSSLWGWSPLPWRVTASVGLFGGLLYALLVYQAFVYAPAAHGSVLLSGSLPLWMALLAWLVLGERISGRRGLSLGLILLGGLLVGGASLWHAEGQVWRGDLLLIVSAMCWGIYSVLVRHHALEAVRATVAITAFACLTYVPIYLLLVLTNHITSHLLTAPLQDVLFQVVTQGWGSVVVAGITFTKMIGYFGPVRSSMITALVPGLSAVAAVLVLNEPLHWYSSLGLVLVTVGIVLGVRAAAAPPAPQSAAAL
jgi:drug/metabolite transporter (DMT)-like permease